MTSKMINQKIQCSYEVPAKMISSNEVHIWSLFFNAADGYTETLQSNLSVDESERAAKFHFEKDRRRFIIARGALRTILGYYLGKKPNAIIFNYTSFGKPMIADNQNNNINFNISHSDDLALYAITLNRKIGIDVERIKNDIHVLQIANKFFSPKEIAALESADKKNQHKIFFQLWTRKEALVKGLGESLSFPLEQINVSSIIGNSLSPILLPCNYKENLNWYVQDLYPKEGYTAAIAAENNNCNILCWYNAHKILSPRKYLNFPSNKPDIKSFCHQDYL